MNLNYFWIEKCLWILIQHLIEMVSLQQKNFIPRQVRGVVCDKHAANVLAYKKMKEGYLDDVESFCISYKRQRVYLFYDVMHLINKFEAIFWAIRGSYFQHLKVLVLNRMWICLVESYRGGYCMMCRMPIVYEVQTWEKHPDSMLR